MSITSTSQLIAKDKIIGALGKIRTIVDTNFTAYANEMKSQASICNKNTLSSDGETFEERLTDIEEDIRKAAEKIKGECNYIEEEVKAQHSKEWAQYQKHFEERLREKNRKEEKR